MLNQRPKDNPIETFKVIRSIFDKIFIVIGGILWIFATLWDILKLQRYWLDYVIEFYSSFFIFYMILYSLNPNSLPTAIYNSFKLITTIRGRGTLLIIISSLFINDKHFFHKFCAILLFIGGIIYFICEILVPTTKEELDKIESIFNKNTNKNNNVYDSKLNNTQLNPKSINNSNIQIDQSAQIFKENDNIEVIIKGNNNNLVNNESDDSNINAINIGKNKEEKEENNKDNNDDINNNNIEETIVKKTDNPYEIPEDF